MESIEQIQQLIAETESQTNRLDEKILEEGTKLTLVETDIEHLRVEVDKIEVTQVKGDRERLNKDIHNTQEALNALSQQIRLAKTAEQSRQKECMAQIERLQAHKTQLQTHLQEKTLVDTSRETQANEDLSAAQKRLNLQNQQFQALLAHLQRENIELSALQVQIDAIHSQEKHAVLEAEEITFKWKTEEAALLEELNNLEKQAAKLDQSIGESVAAFEIQNQSVLKEVTQHKVELAAEKELNKRLTSSRHSTESQIKQLQKETTFEQTKIEEFQKIIVALEVEAKKLEQEITNLKKTNKETIESIKKEEQRQKEEQAKSKIPKKSTKDIINKEEKEYQKLSRELQRENSRLESEIKLKSTYISADNLSILQREYQRHRQPNGPSLELKTAQRDRLTRNNKALIDSIANLKKLIKENEAKESKLLTDSRKKGDIMIAENLAMEKQQNNNRFKLEEYKKAFPNHMSKAEREKKEKYLAQQAKIISSTVDDVQPAPLVRRISKFKSKQNRQTNNDEINNLINEFNETKPSSEQSFQQTTWFKRRSLKDFELQPERPFYKNLYFQAATLLFGLLVVVMIS